MNSKELVESVILDVDKLTVRGVEQCQLIVNICQKLAVLRKELQKNQELKKARDAAVLQDKQRELDKARAEAAIRGEEIVGGETIKVNADGTCEKIVG